MKTPTHQMKDGHGPVRAWQNNQGAALPVWVARHFHALGSRNGSLTALAGKQLITAQTTDWIVDLGGVAVVLTDKEFADNFEPLSL